MSIMREVERLKSILIGGLYRIKLGQLFLFNSIILNLGQTALLNTNKLGMTGQGQMKNVIPFIFAHFFPNGLSFATIIK